MGKTRTHSALVIGGSNGFGLSILIELLKCNYSLINAFVLNQISKNKNFKKLKIKYHFWVDPMFFNETKDNKSNISADLFNHMLDNIKFNKDVICFVNVTPSNAIVKELLKKTSNIFYYPDFNKIEKSLDNKLKLTRFCPSFANVLEYSIYTAIAMCYINTFLNNIKAILYKKASNEYYGYNVSKTEANRMVNHANEFPISASAHLFCAAKSFKEFEYLDYGDKKIL